jgi:hypothetical protein
MRGRSVRALGREYTVPGGDLPDGVDAYAARDVQRHRHLRHAGDDELRFVSVRDGRLQEHVHGCYSGHRLRRTDDVRERNLRATTQRRSVQRGQPVYRWVELLPGRGKPGRVLRHRMQRHL